MKQFVVGAGSALLLAAGGVVWWSGSARVRDVIPPRPEGAAVTPYAAVELPEPPAASEKTREEKRFARYDKDKNSVVARDEYLAARHKAFAKLDTNGDGRLAFEEYATKAVEKFGKADQDRSGGLSAQEFAATRAPRKAKSRADCPPVARREEE